MATLKRGYTNPSSEGITTDPLASNRFFDPNIIRSNQWTDPPNPTKELTPGTYSMISYPGSNSNSPLFRNSFIRTSILTRLSELASGCVIKLTEEKNPDWSRARFVLSIRFF